MFAVFIKTLVMILSVIFSLPDLREPLALQSEPAAECWEATLGPDGGTAPVPCPAVVPPEGWRSFPEAVEQWRPLVRESLQARGVWEPWREDWFLATMQCESGGNPDAVNASSGASGLMQHLPGYWAERAVKAGRPGEDRFDPAANIDVSAWLAFQAQGGGLQHWVCTALVGY